jgi:hypothetical protein
MSPEYIARQLAPVAPAERPAARLALDLEALLIGPTSAHNAARLAAAILAITDADNVAAYLDEIATRYRKNARTKNV